jgi:hypothetical protein
VNVDKYFIEEYIEGPSFTAGVVRKDNEAILVAEGFKPLKFLYHQKGSTIVKLLRLYNAFILAFGCSKNGLVVFQLPLHASIYSLLLSLLKWRGAATIGLIIDIDGVRDKDENLLKKEMALFEKFDSLIVHNAAMANLISTDIHSVQLIPIEIFDYPFKGAATPKKLSKQICIAANFSKAPFVAELSALNPLQFFLYGTGYNQLKLPVAGNVFYKGVLAPALLPAHIEGSFGLVWDGSSIEKCDPYLAINSPHKLSLYMAAGMPVIVWENSAVASFVKKEGLGFTVNSLSEIDARITGISAGAYTSMQQNIVSVAQKISTGFYLKKAIKKATNSIVQKKTA